jgi:hypothetical protein
LAAVSRDNRPPDDELPRRILQGSRQFRRTQRGVRGIAFRDHHDDVIAHFVRDRVVVSTKSRTEPRAGGTNSTSATK